MRYGSKKGANKKSETERKQYVHALNAVCALDCGNSSPKLIIVLDSLRDSKNVVLYLGKLSNTRRDWAYGAGSAAEIHTGPTGFHSFCQGYFDSGGRCQGCFASPIEGGHREKGRDDLRCCFEVTELKK